MSWSMRHLGIPPSPAAVPLLHGTHRQQSRLGSFRDKYGCNSPSSRVNGYSKSLPAAEFLLEKPLVERSTEQHISEQQPSAWHAPGNNTHAFVNGNPSPPNGTSIPKSTNHSKEQDVLRDILQGSGYSGCPQQKGVNGQYASDVVPGGNFRNTDLALLKFHEQPVQQDYWIPQARDREPGTGAVFAVEMCVRDYELDQYGVVNHSIFINYLDHARHEFLAHIGLDPDSVAKCGNALAIVRQELKYCGPLRSRDKFRSTVFVTKLTKARCIWTEEVWKIGETDELVASAETEGLCLDKDYRPIRVPAFAVENLNNFSRGSDVCVCR